MALHGLEPSQNGVLSVDDILRNTSADDIRLDKGAKYLIDANLRVFNFAVLTISRFSDQLHLEPTSNGLCLKALNASKSAYASILFTNQFFSECDLSNLNQNADDRICRISMKSALSIFGRSSFGAATQHNGVLSCGLQIDPLADYLIARVVCMYHVTKCYVIPLRDCVNPHRFLFNDKRKLRNQLTLQARSLLSVITQIGSDVEELKIVATPNRFSVERFIITEEERKCMRKTEAIIDLGCFERFHLQCPSEVAVNVKEFKAVLNFADFCGMSVNLHFDQPGKPLIVAVEENIDFCAEFVLATFQSSYYEEENAEAVAPVCNLNDIAEMAAQAPYEEFQASPEAVLNVVGEPTSSLRDNNSVNDRNLVANDGHDAFMASSVGLNNGYADNNAGETTTVEQGAAVATTVEQVAVATAVEQVASKATTVEQVAAVATTVEQVAAVATTVEQVAVATAVEQVAAVATTVEQVAVATAVEQVAVEPTAAGQRVNEALSENFNYNNDDDDIVVVGETLVEWRENARAEAEAADDSDWNESLVNDMMLETFERTKTLQSLTAHVQVIEIDCSDEPKEEPRPLQSQDRRASPQAPLHQQVNEEPLHQSSTSTTGTRRIVIDEDVSSLHSHPFGRFIDLERSRLADNNSDVEQQRAKSPIYDICENLSCSPSVYLNGDRMFKIRLDETEMERLKTIHEQMSSEALPDSEPSTSYIGRALEAAVEKTKPQDNSLDDERLFSPPRNEELRTANIALAVNRRIECLRTPSSKNAKPSNDLSPNTLALDTRLGEAAERLKSKFGALRNWPGADNNQIAGAVSDAVYGNDGGAKEHPHALFFGTSSPWLSSARMNTASVISSSGDMEDDVTRVDGRDRNIPAMGVGGYTVGGPSMSAAEEVAPQLVDDGGTTRRRASLRRPSSRVNGTVSAASNTSVLVLEEDVDCDGGWLRKPTTQQRLLSDETYSISSSAARAYGRPSTVTKSGGSTLRRGKTGKVAANRRNGNEENDAGGDKSPLLTTTSPRRPFRRKPTAADDLDALFLMTPSRRPSPPGIIAVTSPLKKNRRIS